MGASLLQVFRDLDRDTKERLADISSPQLLSFAALSIAQDKGSADRLSAEHIVACLEAAGIAVEKKSVSRALARSGKKVSTMTGLEGEVLYRLMITGEREIGPHLGGGGLSVIRFEGSKPRTGRMRLGEVLATLKGMIRICDQYYGVRTLDSLDLVPTSCAVRFLTAKTNESARQLAGALKDFRKVRPNVEFRIAADPSQLHDRYVLSPSRLILVGHGLKDIGGKESFLVQIDAQLAKGIIARTINDFDSRWDTGTTI